MRSAARPSAPLARRARRGRAGRARAGPARSRAPRAPSSDQSRRARPRRRAERVGQARPRAACRPCAGARRARPRRLETRRRASASRASAGARTSLCSGFAATRPPASSANRAASRASATCPKCGGSKAPPEDPGHWSSSVSSPISTSAPGFTPAARSASSSSSCPLGGRPRRGSPRSVRRIGKGGRRPAAGRRGSRPARCRRAGPGSASGTLEERELQRSIPHR